MSNEEKIIKKLKAKQKCIKILNVSCYIGTFILILILLLTGLQSCKQNKGYSSVSAESPTPVENLARTQWRFNNDIGNALPVTGEIVYHVPFQTLAGTGYNYIIVNNSSLRYEYQLNDEPYWAYDSDYGWDGISGQTITFYGEFNSINYTSEPLINFLNECATLVNPLTTFTFLKDYNYNAPLGVNLGISGTPIMNDLAWVNKTNITPPSTATETTARLYLFPFYANGVVYNSIISHYAIARDNSNVLYLRDNTDDIIKAKNLTPVYTYLEFAYFEPNGVITDSTAPTYSNVVNIRDTTQASVSNNTVDVYEISSTWVNDGYRRLNFSGYVLTGDLSTRMTAFNNNNQIEIYTDDSALSNTFQLFSGVFTAIVPFLSITILPGITIGLLVFIPLITAVIFFIIDKIKK